MDCGGYEGSKKFDAILNNGEKGLEGQVSYDSDCKYRKMKYAYEDGKTIHYRCPVCGDERKYIRKGYFGFVELR